MTDLEIFIKMIKPIVPAWADEENYFEQGTDSHGYPFVTIYGTDDQEIKFYFRKDGSFDTFE